MTALTLTLIKLAFLAVLWLFVLVAVGVIRTDLFGERTPPKTANVHPKAGAQTKRKQQEKVKPKPVKQPKPAKSARKIVVTGGARAGATISLGESPITIGRANDTTFAVGDDYASGRHARLFPQDGQWLVEDLGSTNGTYLGRDRVKEPTPVPSGVPIRIGKTTLELRR